MLLVWPRARGDWGPALAGARESIATAAKAIAASQRVILIAADEDALASIELRSDLSSNNLDVVHIPNNDIWIRDYGPLTTFNADGQRHFLDCRFNGWAGKYPANLDDEVAQILINSQHLGEGHLQRRDYILEGGAIESNGIGELLVTHCCLLGVPRNPGDSKAIWNERFAQDLGISQVHWIENGQLQGDDTDGHVDTLVRFVGHDHIVFQSCDDPSDRHYESLQKLGDELQQLKQSNGQPYRVQPLPWPQAQYDEEDGRRLPAGYANFLIANNVVLVPQYNDPADAAALAIIAQCFPNRRAIGIDCAPLIRQNGAIHCAAMQIPAAQIVTTAS